MCHAVSCMVKGLGGVWFVFWPPAVAVLQRPCPSLLTHEYTYMYRSPLCLEGVPNLFSGSIFAPPAFGSAGVGP